ncbi:MAG: pyridoxamine 5'-phosphate oxidase family protein [Prevotellaceae bacterium]|nr:pyridoxamine 5'-phosphate oxidase family protein [Prevotellaceae bacterium]
MQEIDPKITGFIKEHHVLTLATCVDNVAYCANMFYTYIERENCFIFTSDRKTRHINDVLVNKQVAGSIAFETETIGKIQGLQFQGEMKKLKGTMKIKAAVAYLSRFPYAALKGTPLWMIEMTFAKLTDNRLGFGKKLIWNKDTGMHSD